MAKLSKARPPLVSGQPFKQQSPLYSLPCPTAMRATCEPCDAKASAVRIKQTRSNNGATLQTQDTAAPVGAIASRRSRQSRYSVAHDPRSDLPGRDVARLFDRKPRPHTVRRAPSMGENFSPRNDPKSQPKEGIPMTTADDAQRKADEKLLALEKLDKIYDLFAGMGLDEASAMLLAKAEQENFSWNSVRLTYGPNKIGALDASVAEHYKLTLPNLFRKEPEQKAEQQIGDVDPALVSAALDGSITARGQVFRALHLNERDPHSVVRLDSFLDTQKIKAGVTAKAEASPVDLQKAGGSNPWAPGSWNLTRQMQAYQSDPGLAARLAKAAGSRIGAARPTKAA